MGARETALQVLTACRNNHAWADAALKAQLSRDGKLKSCHKYKEKA